MLGEDLALETVHEAAAAYESMRTIAQPPWSTVEA